MIPRLIHRLAVPLVAGLAIGAAASTVAVSSTFAATSTVAAEPATTSPPPAPGPTAPTPAATTSAAAAVPDGWTQITDATSTITVAVPVEWGQVSTAPDESGGSPRPIIAASPDLVQFQASFAGSGLLYSTSAFAEIDHEELALSFPSFLVDDHGCSAPSAEPHDGPTLRGVRVILTGCTAGASEYHLLSVSAADQSMSAMIAIGIAAPDTREVADQIVASLALPPGPPTTSTATLPTTPPTTTLAAFPSPSGSTPPDWTVVTDASGLLQVTVPPSWTQVAGEPFGDKASLSVAPDLAAFDDLAGPQGPGAYLGEWLYTEFTDTGLGFYSDECTDGGAQPFSTGTLTGHLHVYSACSFNAAATVYFVAANAEGLTTRTLIATIVLTGAPDDAATLDGLLGSLQLLG